MTKHKIEISNQDKVFFPKSGITKGEMIDYYRKVSKQFVYLSESFPVAMQRFPDGIHEEGFFQKDASDYFPRWIDKVKFPRRKGGHFDAPIISDKSTLVYLANQAMITPHLYLAEKDKLEYASKMVFDIDPPEGTDDYSTARKATFAIKDIIENLEMKGWVMTTGSNGYHIIVALDGKSKFDDVRSFAADMTKLVLLKNPDEFTSKQLKEKRKGRVYIDIGRNSYGATSVAAYGIRAKENAPIAIPVTWQEIQNGTNPKDWTLGNIDNRLDDDKQPWKSIWNHRFSIKKRHEKLRKMLERESNG
ncbi:MAG: DNA polymerase domain-containing protein [Candidatus Zixiibacteriota bacterium]